MERENGAQDGQAVTGEPRVDQVIAGLDRLAGLPLGEHVALFEDTHAQLREVLSELDASHEQPGPA